MYKRQIRNSSPYHTLWWLTNLSNHTTLHTLMASLSLLICEWRNQLHASFYIAFNQLHSTPTSPTAFTQFSHFHTVKRFLSQVRNLWCFHLACMQGTVQYKSKGTNVTSYEWRGTRSPLLNFLFISRENRNSLPFLFPSTLTRNNTWIQMGWCCDFRCRQQYHSWKQTSP